MSRDWGRESGSANWSEHNYINSNHWCSVAGSVSVQISGSSQSHVITCIATAAINHAQHSLLNRILI